VEKYLFYIREVVEQEAWLVALKDVLKRAVIHDGVARGLHEAVKALDKRQAHLCVLSANCSEPAYTK
jgi:small subunit ribosomal protein S12e